MKFLSKINQSLFKIIFCCLFYNSSYGKTDIFIHHYSKFIVAIENEDLSGIFYRGLDIIEIAYSGDIDAIKQLYIVYQYCPTLKKNILYTLKKIKREKSDISGLCESIINKIS